MRAEVAGGGGPEELRREKGRASAARNQAGLQQERPACCPLQLSGVPLPLTRLSWGPGVRCVRSQPLTGTSEAPAGRTGSGLARTARSSTAQRPARPALRKCGGTAGRGPCGRDPAAARQTEAPRSLNTRPHSARAGRKRKQAAVHTFRGGGVVGARPAPGSGPGGPFRIRPSVRVSVSVRPPRARGRGKCRAGLLPRPVRAPLPGPGGPPGRGPEWGPGLGFRAGRGAEFGAGVRAPGRGSCSGRRDAAGAALLPGFSFPARSARGHGVAVWDGLMPGAAMPHPTPGDGWYQ